MTITLRETNTFTPDQVKIIKDMYAPTATDSEISVFSIIAKKTNLDPFSRQIFPVKRFNSILKREVMTVQTGIDGYRLIADRTGCYAPGRDTEFGYSESGNLLWAKSFIKKKTLDGTWHEFSCTAYWDEYAQRTKSGELNSFWKSKPRTMLSKCAEAGALRRAFPQELSGLYTKDEMDSDESDLIPEIEEIKDVISRDQANELISLFKQCDPQYIEKVWVTLKKPPIGISVIEMLPANLFERIKMAAVRNRDEFLKKSEAVIEQSEEKFGIEE